MSDRRELREAAVRVLDREEVEGVLSSSFYVPADKAVAEPPSCSAAGRQQAQNGSPEKPLHYKVICISMYTEDLKRLDGMVDALKSRGLTKANRSALIRYALGAVDVDTVPKGL